MSEAAAEAFRKAVAMRVAVGTGRRFSIEIDVAPGGPSPGDLLAGVLVDLPITIDPEATDSRSFGCWTWLVPKDQHETYRQHRETVKQRIRTLHDRGQIRYGSW